MEVERYWKVGWFYPCLPACQVSLVKIITSGCFLMHQSEYECVRMLNRKQLHRKSIGKHACVNV